MQLEVRQHLIKYRWNNNMYRLMFDISRTFWLGGRSTTNRRAAPGQLQYLLIWNTIDNEVRVVDWFNLKYMKKSRSQRRPT